MTVSPLLSRVVHSVVKIHIFHRLGPVPKHRTPDSTQPHPLRIHPDWTSCQCEHHLHAWRGAPLWSVWHWQSSSLALKIDRTVKLARYECSVWLLGLWIAVLILVFMYWRFFQYAVAGKLNRSMYYAEPDVRVNGKKELIRNRRELAFRKGHVCCTIKPIVASWWFFWVRSVLDYHTLLKGVIFCICMFAYRQKNRWGSLWLSRPLMRADFPCRSRSLSSLMPKKCFYQPALLKMRYHRVCEQLWKKLL